MSRLLNGRYELVEKIGEGGMAVVYKAKDRLLNRFVAVKVLRPEFTKDVQFVTSFRQESQAAAGLQHPNIISVFDVGQEGEIYFIVMELVDGIPLSDCIREYAPMDYRDVVKITKQVAAALNVAHSHNIIHRDIKPHNIMLTRDGTVKLGDFGIAKAISDATLTETSKIIGSVHYFSPEQARGSYVDERSDIYSLGIIMFEMLTGRVPFDGENPVQVALMHINNEVPKPSLFVPGVPPSLDKIVQKATNRFQSNRYKSAAELLEDLDGVELVTRMMGNGNADSGRIRSDTYVPANTYYGRQSGGYDDGYGADDDGKQDRQSKDGENNKNGKKKKNNKAVIIGIVAAAAVIAVAAVVMFSGRQGVEVPDVTGMNYDSAYSTLTAQGFKVVQGESVNSTEYEKDKVAKQDPAGGTKADKESTVTICLSKGAETDRVPDLIGKYYNEDTGQMLEDNGFTLGKVSHAKSDEYEKGQIIEQSPSGGSSAEKGTSIDITVCTGNATEMSAVPTLTGLTLAQAKAKLSAAGLKVGNVDYVESNVYGKGYVMWQQYDAGAEVKKGQAVDIQISKGTAEIPDKGDQDTGNGQAPAGGQASAGGTEKTE